MYKPLQPWALGLSLTLLALPAAHAVKYGIQPSMAPDAPAIVNPFTGQATDAWKLVGYLGCSGFQISREWAIHAGHCGINADATATFRNHLGSSPVLGTDCYRQGSADFQLCRLQTPTALTAASGYPALLALPWYWRTYPEQAAKFGSLMAYGRSGAGDGLAFVSLDGLPFNYNPITPTSPQIPFPVGGDSGGAAYWFAPNSATPYMVGVLVGGTTLNYSPLYFTEENLAWIKSTIEARGDVAPPMATASQVYTPPAGNPAPELTTPPTFVPKLDLAGTVLQWKSPSTSVTSYQVQVGRNGTIERNLTVSAGGALATPLTGLAADIYLACVRPFNALGGARAARAALMTPKDAAWYMTTTTPNCARLDMRVHQSTVAGVVHSGTTVQSSRRLVNFAWNAATPVPQDMVIQRYRVSQTTSYPTGPSRSQVFDTATTAATVTAMAGTRVCVRVAALSDGGQVGPASAAVCTNVN